MHQTDSDNPFVRILDTQRLNASERIEVSVANGNIFLDKAFDSITAGHPIQRKRNGRGPRTLPGPVLSHDPGTGNGAYRL